MRYFQCRLSKFLLLGFLAVPACGLVDRVMGRNPEGVSVAAPAGTLPGGALSEAAPMGGAKSAEALDQSTAAQKAIATAASALGGDRDLGSVVVALGSPAEQGFWLRSTLVEVSAKGRVVTAAGKSVAVDLQPGTGGALLSLAAFRALGLGLTDLPELKVYAN